MLGLVRHRPPSLPQVRSWSLMPAAEMARLDRVAAQASHASTVQTRHPWSASDQAGPSAPEQKAPPSSNQSAAAMLRAKIMAGVKRKEPGKAGEGDGEWPLGGARP